MNSSAQMAVPPPLAKIAAALREITEILARELTSPTDDPPAWGDFEWCIARAVTTMQGISSLLCAGLRWKSPAHFRRFLEEQRDHTAARHLRIEQLLDRIDSSARREGIMLVALKGAALHRRGICKAGERPMADIDLLVRGADAEATTRLLADYDFDVTFTTWRHQLLEARLAKDSIGGAFGEHADNPIKIELHTRIRERLPVSETDITQFLFPGDARAGINTYPSGAALMMHLLLHAAGNMRAHALRLIQLHDVACLAASFGSTDWDELMAARPNDRGLWWSVPPLRLTAHYFPAAIPPLVLARLDGTCSWLLRKLSRNERLAVVSWSNMRVHAFPGIGWSRTPREALTFMISRIWPSREALSEIKRFAAHQPGAADIPWYGISQGARIRRWIVSRPPRVQTLLSVRAAFAQRYDEAGCTVTSDNLNSRPIQLDENSPVKSP
jgi:hypothetical protein